MTRRLIPAPLAGAAALLVAACGGPAPGTTTTAAAPAALVDPAALYCQGTGGTVIPRISQGRRADLCRIRDGRTVSAAALLNSHNDL